VSLQTDVRFTDGSHSGASKDSISAFSAMPVAGAKAASKLLQQYCDYPCAQYSLKLTILLSSAG